MFQAMGMLAKLSSAGRRRGSDHDSRIESHHPGHAPEELVLRLNSAVLINVVTEAPATAIRQQMTGGPSGKNRPPVYYWCTLTTL